MHVAPTQSVTGPDLETSRSRESLNVYADKPIYRYVADIVRSDIDSNKKAVIFH